MDRQEVPRGLPLDNCPKDLRGLRPDNFQAAHRKTDL
jgi:hypothetical protein